MMIKNNIKCLLKSKNNIYYNININNKNNNNN